MSTRQPTDMHEGGERRHSAHSSDSSYATQGRSHHLSQPVFSQQGLWLEQPCALLLESNQLKCLRVKEHCLMDGSHSPVICYIK